MNCICTAICGKCGLLWSLSRSLSLSSTLSFSLSLSHSLHSLTLQFVTVFMQMHERACVTMLHIYLYVCVCVFVCVCTFCELSRFGYTCWQRTPDKLNQHIWRRHNNWAAESKDKWKLSSHTNVSRRDRRREQAELSRSLAGTQSSLSLSLCALPSALRRQLGSVRQTAATATTRQRLPLHSGIICMERWP